MLEVKRVENGQDLERFLRFPWQIYRQDPYWVPPYLSQQRKRLDPARNPFFQHASQQLFLAGQNGRTAGTIAAIINHQNNQQLGERTGFFGFFESVDHAETAAALVEAAAGWLREQGMERIRGPVNGALTDEVGVLISGHQTRPAMWEGHTPAYYQSLLEDLGFQKFDDVLAYELTYRQLEYNLKNLPARFLRVAQIARSKEDLNIRSTDRRRWDEDVLIVHQLYNTAFRTIEGHNDMSLEKFKSLAASVKPFLDMDLVQIAEVDGTPAGFAVALLDINEALRHFNGEISYWGALKFRWHLKRIRTVCFKLLGVLPEYRGRGIEAALMMETGKQIVKKRYDRLEASLASEKNRVVNRLIQRMGGRVYRRYRIYERALH
jgi:GNAT superfamily N-acetyltransferase